jgi:ABC-2 type transport system permease protein
MWLFITRVAAMAGKETLHIRRDPLTLWLGFGFGISFDLDHIPLAVVDQDNTTESRELRQLFTAGSEFIFAGALDNPDDALDAFGKSQAHAVLTIPEGYAAALSRGEDVQVGLILDAADANSAQQALARADAFAQLASAQAAQRRGLDLTGSMPVSARTWTRYNPAGRSALFLVPGVTAYVMALVSVLLTALAVSKEWEQGSMEQLFATPVRRSEIVVGKLLPYLGMGIIQVLLVLVAGTWIFGLPTNGNGLVVALGSLLFMVGMLGQGLLISIVARNQMVASLTAVMTAMLPSMLLSGFMFPVENMPFPLRMLSNMVPARYYIQVLRGTLLKDNGFAELAIPLVLLAAFATLMMVVSTVLFKRTLA